MEYSIERGSMSYIITGRAAHGRVARLFRELLDENCNNDEGQQHQRNSQHGAGGNWVDRSPYAEGAVTNGEGSDDNGEF
jgi:hypothetical protein